MDYQKLLTEEEISNIYVAEGDIVSFYNSEGKLCTKDSFGNISIVEDRVKTIEDEILEIKQKIQTSEEIITEIDDIIGGEELSDGTEEEIEASEELLNIL